MKLKLFLLALPFISIYFSGCITTDGLIRLQVMENICVSDVSYEIIRPLNLNGQTEISFRAVLSNPSIEDGEGTVRLVMGVDASGLGLPGGVQSISANSTLPFFENPVTTKYPGNQLKSYTSPVLITMPYSPGATYKIEVRKFLAPQQDSDESSCHNFKVTKQL